MREQIQKLLNSVPFEPFIVDVAEDVIYSIPTRDHAFIGKAVLVVSDDEGYVNLLSYHNIRRITHKATNH